MCKFLPGHKFSNSLVKYWGARLLDHMVKACFVSGGTLRLSSKVAAPLYSHQRWTRFSLASHPGQYRVFVSVSGFQVWAIPLGVSWHCIVWIYISSMTCVEHLFIWLFGIYISSLVKCQLRFLCPLFNWNVRFLFWVLRVLYTFWVTVLYQNVFRRYFLPVWLAFSFQRKNLSHRRIFNINEVKLVDFFFHESCLGIVF